MQPSAPRWGGGGVNPRPTARWLAWQSPLDNTERANHQTIRVAPTNFSHTALFFTLPSRRLLSSWAWQSRLGNRTFSWRYILPLYQCSARSRVLSAWSYIRFCLFACSFLLPSTTYSHHTTLQQFPPTSLSDIVFLTTWFSKKKLAPLPTGFALTHIFRTVFRLFRVSFHNRRSHTYSCSS